MLDKGTTKHEFDSGWKTSIHSISNFSDAFAGKRLISIPLIMQEIHPEPETLVC